MDNQLENHGVSRRTSIAATLASGISLNDKDTSTAKAADQTNNDAASGHVALDHNNMIPPKKKNKIWITFSGLQIALFLAALDRYDNREK